MSCRRLSLLGVSALVLATSVLVATPAVAQSASEHNGRPSDSLG